jgi:predicted alpha/beta superfamily hydrolase
MPTCRLSSIPRNTVMAVVIGSLIGSPASSAASRADKSTAIERWSESAGPGEDYAISIARPSQPAPPEGYPAIYVLDAQWSFETLAETAKLQEPVLGPIVVIGIGYPQGREGKRLRDMTIPVDRATLPSNRFDPPYGEIGGADRFLSFIVEKVTPAAKRRVHIDPRRQTLFGHSLGGLLVLHTLFTRPDTFQTYVAASPSIWWGNRAIVGEMRSLLKADVTHARRLLLTVGSLEQTPQPVDDQLAAASASPKDRAAVIEMSRCLTKGMAAVDHTRWLANTLHTARPGNLVTTLAVFDGETHLSVLPAALSRGLNFAVQPPSASAIVDRRRPDTMDALPSANLLECTKAHK